MLEDIIVAGLLAVPITIFVKFIIETKFIKKIVSIIESLPFGIRTSQFFYNTKRKEILFDGEIKLKRYDNISFKMYLKVKKISETLFEYKTIAFKGSVIGFDNLNRVLCIEDTTKTIYAYPLESLKKEHILNINGKELSY